jgi:low temperature requirement protein LtrA
MTSDERRTSPVELLWDLVFVFAVTQVSTLLRGDLTWPGFGRAMLIVALVWWAWSAFVWATNAQDPDTRTFRGVLLVATAMIFIAGIAVPGAFGREAVLFVVAYACVRFLHLGLYVDASRRGNAKLSAIAGFSVTIAIGMALLVAGAIVGGWERTVLWTLAAAIDYAGPAWLTRERLRGLQQVAVTHFSERYGLFIIICLGESVVAIGLGTYAHVLTAARVAEVALALLITIGMWWIYFDRFAATAEARLRTLDDPVLAAADGYSYLHLALVAGIIVFAVGARDAVAYAGSPLATPARLALCGGVAMYLVGHTAFRLRMTGTLDVVKLAGAIACLAVVPLTAHDASWITAGAVAAVLAMLVWWESVSEREQPESGVAN